MKKIMLLMTILTSISGPLFASGIEVSVPSGVYKGTTTWLTTSDNGSTINLKNYNCLVDLHNRHNGDTFDQLIFNVKVFKEESNEILFERTSSRVFYSIFHKLNYVKAATSGGTFVTSGTEDTHTFVYNNSGELIEYTMKKGDKPLTCTNLVKQ